MTLISRLLGAALLACAAISANAALQASPPLVIFGDSLSDNGNNSLVFGNDPSQVIGSNFYIPSQTYSSGTYSNGPVWATQFATLLGLPLAPSLLGGGDYAYGGSVTGIDQTYGTAPNTVTLPSVKSQATQYLASFPVFAPSTLFVVAGGGNDARGILDKAADVVGGGGDPSSLIQAGVNLYIANVGNIVDSLQAAGAQHIVVWNTPNIGATPAVTFAGGSVLGTTIATAMNNALATRLFGEAGVQTFDIFGLVPIALSQGFVNATDACGNTALSCNGDLAHSVFWDGIHPTTAAHSLIANQMQLLVTAVPEPSEIAMMLAGLLLVVRVARRKAVA